LSSFMLYWGSFLIRGLVNICSMKLPFLYLAPLKGITDWLFRNIFFDHFDGFHMAVAPFINPQRFSSFKDKHLSDILPENNQIDIIPQLLHTDADDFLALAARVHDLGYQELNWNLGCPAPMVTRKKRGSGLLPYPEKIISFLEQVIPKLETRLSIKMRLGFESPDEIMTLLPLLNDFPLSEIIIHSRTGKQRYSGQTDPEAFLHCSELSDHLLVYNGDITTPGSFEKLACLFPDNNRWMIGRGMLADPFLGERIQGKTISKDEQLRRLSAFHADLFNEYKARLSGPGHLLSRMKQIWCYLRESFPRERKLTKNILRSKNIDQYERLIVKLF